MNAEAVDTGPLRVPLVPLIAWLLPLGGRAFARAVGTSPLVRAGRHRLLRNAIHALANSGAATAHADLLARAEQDAREEVRAAAERALRTSPSAPRA